MTDTAPVRTVGLGEVITITRVFDAPRDLVWQAWTEPHRIQRWWGPAGFTSPVCTVDLRVGGRYVFCMRSPEGVDYWVTGVYREVSAPERLVYTDSFADQHGNPVPASHYGMGDDLPMELEVSVTLTEQDGKTVMTLRHVGLPAGELQEMTAASWNESFDKFAATLPQRLIITLPSDREVVMTRTFDAPRELVFRAYTDPELVARWWGPRAMTTTVDQLDPRPGGAWRFVQRSPEGEFAFRGEFREIVPPEKLVYTFEFEGMPGHVLVETVTFTKVDGKTLLTDHALFASMEDRDGMINSGMEWGANESMDQLEEVLAAMM